MWVSHKWDYGLASPSEWWPSGRWSSCPVHSRVWPLVRWSCRTWLTRVCRLASPQTYALQKHPSSMSSEQWGSALCLLSPIYCNEMRNQFFWCQNIWLKKWRQNRWVQSVRVSCEAMYCLRAQCLHRWQHTSQTIGQWRNADKALSNRIERSFVVLIPGNSGRESRLVLHQSCRGRH